MFIESNRARWGVIFLAIVLAAWWIFPNFLDREEGQWWIAQEKLIYGLDIQGGVHLVMGVNVDDVLNIKKLKAKQDLVDRFEKEGIGLKNHSINSDSRIVLNLKQESQISKATSQIEKYYGTDLQILSRSGSELELDYSSIRSDAIRKQIIDQSIEVIRNRVDEFGVSEPLITAQGTHRILVQLPGVKEAQRAKDLIRQTAHLQMRLVSEKVPSEDLYAMIASAEKKGKYSFEKLKSYSKYVARLNKDLKKKLPKNTSIVFSKNESSRTLSAGLEPYVIEMDKGISGGLLSDASVGTGQLGEPIVNFVIAVEGRKQFFELTSKNKNRRLAVILDDVLKSAPNISGSIFDRGQITLGSGDRNQSLQEATDLSITLRAGALPASLEQLEERTVGPTLGKDLIDKGKLAGLIALGLISLFLLLFYRVLGVVANISLFLNVVLLVAFLTSFGATLTLPGVAGIILTVGMAVDANIIIFERIKEEFLRGSSLKLAITEGFARALSAILDANITTAIVCLVLIYFGTGPIRGFAITLMFGIITSVFTAIFVSRTLLNTLVQSFNLKKLG